MREDVMLHFLDATYFKRRESPGLPYGFPVITRLSWALEKQRRGGEGSGELLIRGNAAVGGWGQG